MSRRLRLDVLMGLVLPIVMISMFVASPGFAKDMPTWSDTGKRPVDQNASPRTPSGMSDLSLAPGQGVIGAFTALPTTGNLQGAILAAQNIFSTADPIEFNGILFDTGVAGTRVNYQVVLFDIRGQVLSIGYDFDDNPADKQSYFIVRNAGTLPPDYYKWLMIFYDAFGKIFATPMQSFQVVGAL